MSNERNDISETKEPKKYLKVTHGNRYLFRFKVKESPSGYKTSGGEVDIFLTIPSKAKFDRVCLNTETGKKFYTSSVNNISWHGFYANVDEEIRLPVIHFKDDAKLIDDVRHEGTVNQNDVFLFPICSLYIPANWESKNLPEIQKGEKTHKIEFDQERAGRIDFFVLPKNVYIKEFMSSTFLSMFYFTGDITLFDKSKNGLYSRLPIKKQEDLILQSVNLNGWDVLIRTIYSDSTLEPKLDNTFSILLHDPNDAIEMLLNRPWGYEGENGKMHIQSVRSRHEQDVSSSEE